MPVQINEMIIRANIVETHDKENETKANAHAADSGSINKSEIIQECAELVMEMINNKSQR
jgi:hypothetical protein